MLFRLLPAVAIILLASCNDMARNYEASDAKRIDSLSTPDSSGASGANYDAYVTFENAAGFIPQSVPEYETEASDSTNLPTLVTQPDRDCTPFPATIAELNSGTDMFIYKFNRELSASARAMGYSVELGKKDILFVQDYVRYSDCNDAKRVGIGLRCFIHVKDIHGRVSLDKLSQVGACVEAGKASASFRLKSLGFAIDGSVLVEGLQGQGEYNSEVAGKLTQVYNKVLAMLNASNPMPVRPVVLPKE